MKNKTITDIIDNKVIIILRGVSREKLIPLTEALYTGGIRLVEITYSADGRVPDTAVADNIRLLSETFEGRMTIGAGTVLTAEQVRLTAEAGGKFIIAPDTNNEVIGETVRLGLVSIPGALTPTEAQSAHKYGADFVKLFPVSSLGASYIKALSAPLSHIRFLAVGGVNENNIGEFIRSGAVGVGIGGNLTALLKENDYEAITEMARKYVEGARNG